MISRLSQRYLTPRYQYANLLDYQRARSMLLVLGVGTIGTVLYILILLFNKLNSGLSLTAAELVTILTPVVTLILYYMVQRGLLQLAVLILIGFSFAASYPGMSNGINTINILGIALPVVIAGVLLGWRGTIATLVIAVAVLAQATFFSSLSTGTQGEGDFVLASVFLSLMGLWLIIFGSNVQLAARRTLDNLDNIRQIAQLGTKLDINTSEQQISADVINLIRDQLGFSYAQIFLVDSNRNIYQRIAAGLTQSQLNIDTNIQLSRNSAIERALRSGDTVLITRDSEQQQRGHLLPGISAAAAIPIQSGNATIGILDVQREENRPVSRDEMEVLKLLAGQYSSTLVVSRLINELRENLNEQNTLVENQREKLLLHERAEERATTSSWSAYLQQRGLDYLGFDKIPEQTEPVLATTLTEDLHPAIETGDIVVQQHENHQVVSVPIILRGQPLGAMSFQIPEERQIIGGRQKELIRSVVQRLGLALENKRLFERSQAQAQRESKANEVGGLLLSTTDIEAVLQLAARNFNEALGAIQTRIHLQPEAQEATEG